MLSANLMAPGSYRKVYCRCGRKNCWCYSGKGHPYSRITFSEDGKSRTKSISEKNTGWIKKVTQNYRDFKEGQKKIKEYDMCLIKLLDKYLKEIIEQTRKKKEYN
ncbi:MAG: hypothetical protein COT09_01190 [Candidatus Hydromicrobium americanum]|nr:MAG: hypothetical protein COT09_01190 [Candidatus Hydromicrobium americanum]